MMKTGGWFANILKAPIYVKESGFAGWWVVRGWVS